MKMTNEKKLKNKLVTMLKEDWNGKKGYLTDNEMYRCKTWAYSNRSRISISNARHRASIG
jgi:hypothetical protein